MSSNYQAICLSHDPALTIWSHDERSHDQVAALAYGRKDHPRCALVVGRWSGGLIQVCCPGQVGYPPKHLPPPMHAGWHRDDQWVGAGWLRLLAVADETARDKVGGFDCWTYDTARRLWAVLGLDEERE